ncbi:MAG: hypothetical protein VX498_00370 [Myxococcota bacterium]|nr:hypothetical protein [Myxococcota bacterium]
MPFILVLLLLLAACSVEVEEPTRVFPAQMEANAERLVQGQVTWAVSLKNLDALALVDGILHRIDASSGEASPIFGDPGEVSDAVELPDGSILLSGSEGLFVVQHGEIAPSPLSESLAAIGPSRMLSTASGDLWLASESGLYLWRESVLYSVDVSGFSTADASLAWGPDPLTDGGGPEGLWVASGGSLYFLRADGGGFVAESVREGELAPDLAVDGHLSLWGVVDGDLHRRNSDGLWDWYRLPSPVSAVQGAPGSMSTWLSTEAEIWHYGHDGWSSTDQFGLLADVDGVGRALVLDDEGLLRVWAGRPLLLFGLEDGSELEFTVQLLLVSAPTTARPRSYEVTVGGESRTVEAGPSVLLDPIEFADGAYELSASAYYRTGEVSEASLYFSVGDFEAPTWSADVYPLYQATCTPCHESEGTGHLMNTREAWVSEIDLILENLETDSMPLNNDTNPNIDPLTAAEKQLVRGWAAGGFLE